VTEFDFVSGNPRNERNNDTTQSVQAGNQKKTLESKIYLGRPK